MKQSLILKACEPLIKDGETLTVSEIGFTNNADYEFTLYLDINGKNYFADVEIDAVLLSLASDEEIEPIISLECLPFIEAMRGSPSTLKPSITNPNKTPPSSTNRTVGLIPPDDGAYLFNLDNPVNVTVQSLTVEVGE